MVWLARILRCDGWFLEKRPVFPFEKAGASLDNRSPMRKSAPAIPLSSFETLS